MTQLDDAKIRLGVSACLLGQKVRFDGGHKLNHFVRDDLGRYVEFVSVCPEMECGLGAPRESMRLVGDPDAPRLISSRTKTDLTDRMQAWARGRIKQLAGEGLCGFIFKSRSPSSGMRAVRVYTEAGMPAGRGVGIFARMFMDRFPLLPVEDEGRLNDNGIRENFVERIFCLKRWRDTLAAGATPHALVRFQAEHKYLLQSHSQKHANLMGRLVADLKKKPAADVWREYETLLLETLMVRATVRKHCNVLQHMMGYFKKSLSKDEKEELLEVIEEYRSGHAPLLVPITLMNHYVRKYDEPYLKTQAYLRPHPAELKLRTYVA